MNYLRLLETTRRLIEANGRDATFETLSATPADSSKPWRGPAAPTVASNAVSKAVFVPPTGNEFGFIKVAPDLFARAEQICLVPAHATYDMASCTSINDGSQRWRVEWTWELAPADVPLLFAFGVSR